MYLKSNLKMPQKVEGSGWGFDMATCVEEIGNIAGRKASNLTQWADCFWCAMWEHAYYLDYQNERRKYIDAWWDINWYEVERRLVRQLTVKYRLCIYKVQLQVDFIRFRLIWAFLNNAEEITFDSHPKLC